MVAVATSPKSAVMVIVYPASCFGTHTGGYAALHSPERPSVYLCGHESDEKHELAHWAGFKHTPWTDHGAFACARIVDAGYRTPYIAGKKLCMMKQSRFEWIE